MRNNTSPSFSILALYLLAELPLGILCFTVAIAGLALSVGLAPIVVGLPLLGGVMALGGSIARLEASRSRSLLGSPDGYAAASPGSPVPPPAGGWLARFGRQVSDPNNWKGIAVMIVKLPFSVIAFAFTAVLFSVTLGLLASPIVYYSMLESSGIDIFADNLLVAWAGLSATEAIVIFFALGLLMAGVTAKVLPPFARGYARLMLAMSR